MSVAPVRSDTPLYTYTNPSNKFARVDNNPHVRNGQYYAPYVHVSSSSKNPQFYKSPLTSVEIHRKTRSRNLPLNDGPSHIVQEETSQRGICHGVDWKQILCWALIALAILGLLTGLFFLIRSILTKPHQQNVRLYVPDTIPAPTYTGINPVYVSPIPYSSMEVPTISGYVASPSLSDKYTYVTSPTKVPSLKKQEPTPQPTPPQNPVTQPTIRWIPDLQNSYVNPLDVYKNSHE